MSLAGHFARRKWRWIHHQLTLCSFLSFCVCVCAGVAGGNDFQWCFSQVKGAIDEDVAEGMWLWLACAARLTHSDGDAVEGFVILCTLSTTTQWTFFFTRKLTFAIEVPPFILQPH